MTFSSTVALVGLKSPHCIEGEEQETRKVGRDGNAKAILEPQLTKKHCNNLLPLYYPVYKNIIRDTEWKVKCKPNNVLSALTPNGHMTYHTLKSKRFTGTALSSTELLWTIATTRTEFYQKKNQNRNVAKIRMKIFSSRITLLTTNIVDTEGAIFCAEEVKSSRSCSNPPSG